MTAVPETEPLCPKCRTFPLGQHCEPSQTRAKGCGWWYCHVCGILFDRQGRSMPHPNGRKTL